MTWKVTCRLMIQGKPMNTVTVFVKSANEAGAMEAAVTKLRERSRGGTYVAEKAETP